MEETPSLPSNYVTIIHLKERWLQQNQLHNHRHDAPDSQFNPKSNEGRLPPPNRMPNPQPKSQVKVGDDDDDDDSHSKIKAAVADNPPKGEGEEQQQKTDHSNSKMSKKKKGGKHRKPRVFTNQNPNGGATPPLEPEPEAPKNQFRPNGGRGVRNQKVVWEPKIKTPPFAPKSDDLSHNHAHTQAEAVAVKESNVRVRTNNKMWVSGRSQGKPKPKPEPSWRNRETFVWVKKGESAAN